jgi:peptide/nickel transport system ATP-binding protein
VITGLLPPSQGEIVVAGRRLSPDLKSRTREDLRELQMIYQMADTAMNPRHTVGTIIGRPLEFYFGLKGAARRKRVQELLDEIEMGEGYIHRYPAERSGAQTQRVCIAQVAYLFITHDLATVRAIADSIAVMYQGEVVRYGTKSEVLAPPFDDYTDLLLSSVPEMKLGWLEEVIAHRKMESAGH